MRKLADALYVRHWQYVAVNTLTGDRSRHFINQNLTGAALGGAPLAKITFRMALWIVYGWNEHTKGGNIRFFLLIPNKREE